MGDGDMTMSIEAYTAIRQSHVIQIAALTMDDKRHAFEVLAHELPGLIVHPLRSGQLHSIVWAQTGDIENSLFAHLPSYPGVFTEGAPYIKCGCLTQVKHASRYQGPSAAELKWINYLGINGNQFIPDNVKANYVFSEAQLWEFSRLQLMAIRRARLGP